LGMIVNLLKPDLIFFKERQIRRTMDDSSDGNLES